MEFAFGDLLPVLWRMLPYREFVALWRFVAFWRILPCGDLLPWLVSQLIAWLDGWIRLQKTEFSTHNDGGLVA